MNAAAQDIRVYREAARLNTECPLRRGSTLVFPNYGQLVITGDLHGHRRNYERIQNYCDLPHSPARHVILQEIIHEEPSAVGAADMSHESLLAAARWKLEYPEQVHFLQSNHELAQLISQDISKGGRIVTYTFLAGMRASYGDAYREVAEAMMEFLASYPLAARTPNRVLVTHSLPSPDQMSVFDPTVLDRTPTSRDLLDGGSAYLLVWGRHQTALQLAELARAWDIDYFVCGHQPQETGFDIRHDRLIILASDHNHGAYMAFDLKKTYDIQSLEACIRPLAGIA